MSTATIGRPVSTGTGSRMLLLECPDCVGIKIRAAFGAVARIGYPSCACGHRYAFQCADAHARYCEKRGENDSELFRHPRIAADQSVRDRSTLRNARKGGSGKRHQCGGCATFLKVPNQLCRCGYANDWHPKGGGAWEDRGRYGAGGIIVDDIPF